MSGILSFDRFCEVKQLDKQSEKTKAAYDAYVKAWEKENLRIDQLHEKGNMPDPLHD